MTQTGNYTQCGALLIVSAVSHCVLGVLTGLPLYGLLLCGLHCLSTSVFLSRSLHFSVLRLCVVGRKSGGV